MLSSCVSCENHGTLIIIEICHSAAIMKKDLLLKWLNTSEFDSTPPGRPLKRRRKDRPCEETSNSVSKPPSPSILIRASSDDYPYTDGAKRGLALYLGYPTDSVTLGIRRSMSDRWVIGFEGRKSLEILQAENMARNLRPPPSQSFSSITETRNLLHRVQSVVTSSEAPTGSDQSRITPSNANHRSDVLALNGVHFRSVIDPLPVNVAATVKKTVLRCGSPDTNEALATKIRDKITQLGEHAEADLGHGFLAMDILPFDKAHKTNAIHKHNATKCQRHHIRGCLGGHPIHM